MAFGIQRMSREIRENMSKVITISGDTVLEYTASAQAARKNIRLLGYDPDHDLRRDSPDIGLPASEGSSEFWFGRDVNGDPEVVVRWTHFSEPAEIASAEEAFALMAAMMELAD